MAHPDRVAALVIASAGTYTLPDPELRFPLGIGTRRSRPDLRFDTEKLLRVPVTVFETRQEARPASSRRSEEPPRSDRERNGRSWFAAMKAAAERNGVASAVSYREVQGSVASSFKSYAEQG